MAATLRNREPDVSCVAPWHGWKRSRRYLAVLIGLMFIVAACGEDEPELTMAERLANVEGRELSAAELADRLAIGEALCGMADDVLDEVWRQLNERQLNYQDVVFGHICPDRSVFYASLTGRYVTEEAEESGVVPSTTRPPLTTVAPSTTAAETTTLPPDDSSTVTLGSDPVEEDPDGETTTSDGDAESSTTDSSDPATTTTTTALETSTTIAATTTTAAPEGEGG